MAYCPQCEKNVTPSGADPGTTPACPHCASPLPRHKADKLPGGMLINGFQIIGELGRGGMGVVYRARQLNLERDVAFKVLADDLANDDEFVERFFREARAAASLNHPNIVQVYDAGSTPDGIYYFVMELITGETLETRIVREGAIPPKEALKIAVKMADALRYAWETQKLTHGDIKPDNIILGHGSAKLADLGLAKCAHDETTSTEGVMATPLYAPPEVIRGELQQAGFHSDMYSFGATLYHMLAGEPPFPDDDPEIVMQKHLDDSPPPLTTRCSNIAPTLAQIVESLLEKHPRDRPQSWNDVLKSLKKIRDPEVSGRVFHTHPTHSHAQPVETPQNSQPQAKGLRLPALLALLVALVLILAAAVGVALTQKRHSATTRKPLERENGGTPEDAWRKLEPSLENMDTADAVDAIKALADKYGDELPPEALAVLEEKQKALRDDLAREEAEKKMALEFRTRVDAILKEIGNVDVEDEKTPIKTIRELARRIEYILQKASRNPKMELSKEERETLNGEYAVISERLVKYRDQMKKLARERDELERRKRMAEEEKRKREEHQRRIENLEECAMIDDYYMILASFMEENTLSALAPLADWEKEASTIPAAYSTKVSFLNDTVLPSAPKIPMVLKKHEKSLIGNPLPEKVCSGNLSKLLNFKVKEITASGIKLVMDNKKVVLGQNLKWAAMPKKAFTTIIIEGLLSDGADASLDQSDVNAILSFALLYDMGDFDAVIAKLLDKKYKVDEIWKILHADFIQAPEEKAAIERYRPLKKALRGGDVETAAKILVDTLPSLKGTLFAKRYGEEFSRIEKDLRPRSPIVAAYELIEECARMKDPVERFNMAMTIRSRFGKAANALGKTLKTSLDRSEQQSLSKLVAASGVKSLGDNRVPFYYWTKEKQGAAWAYYLLLDKSGKLKKMPKVLGAEKLAAAFDNGNWEAIAGIIRTRSAAPPETIMKLKFGATWGPSLTFARGMALRRLGDGSEREQISAAFRTMMSDAPSSLIYAMTKSLAIEYALTARQPFPNTTPEKAEAGKRTPSVFWIRTALLELLAAIQNPKSTDTDIGRARQAFEALLAKHTKKRDDINLVQVAVAISRGVTPNAAQMKVLKSIDPLFPDTTARVIVSAIARKHAMKGQSSIGAGIDKGLSPGEVELLRIAEKAISPNVVSGEIWCRSAILKMAANPSPDIMAATARDALKLHWVSTTPYYTKLLILKTGADIASGRIPKAKALNTLKRYLQASPATSPADMKTLEMGNSEIAAAIVESLFKSNQPEKAVTCAIFGVMIREESPKIRAEIIKVLKSHYSTMTWEERFLAQRVRDWRD